VLLLGTELQKSKCMGEIALGWFIEINADCKTNFAVLTKVNNKYGIMSDLYSYVDVINSIHYEELNFVGMIEANYLWAQATNAIQWKK
jgi:hypothetical protein